MSSDTAQSSIWESTLPHFSTVEKHGHITVPVARPSETLRFFAVLTFILWVPVAVGAAFWIHSMQTHNPSTWLGLAAIVGSFLPAILAGILADEALDTFGQRSTANRVAVIPALTGVAVGLLGAALWIGGVTGGVLALVSVVCSAAAAGAPAGAGGGGGENPRRPHP
ncbi:hypothetical protein ABQF45_09825, partial [Mycolicibacterium sp. XJ766]